MTRERERIADELCSVTKLHRMRCLRTVRAFGSCQEAEDFLAWVTKAAEHGADFTDDAAWLAVRRGFAQRPQTRALQEVLQGVFTPNRGALIQTSDEKKYRRPTFNELALVERLIVYARQGATGAPRKDLLTNFANILRAELLKGFPGCELKAVERGTSVQVTVPPQKGAVDEKPMRFFLDF